jgi:hypothetical protein
MGYCIEPLYYELYLILMHIGPVQALTSHETQIQWTLQQIVNAYSARLTGRSVKDI